MSEEVKDLKLSKAELKTFMVMAKGAKQNLEMHGELMPLALVTNSKTGKIAMVGVGSTFHSVEDKEAAATAIRKIVTETKADGVLFLAESWMFKGEGGKEAIEAQRREFNEGVRTGKFRHLGDYPGSVEVVHLTYENVFGTWFAAYEIDRSSGRPTIHLDHEPRYSPDTSGRLTGFLDFRQLFRGTEQ